MHLDDSISARNEQSCSDPEPLFELRGHRATVLSACFSPDARNLVTGGLDSQLLFYRLDRSAHHFRLNGHTDAINSVHFADTAHVHQSFVLSGSRDKTVRLWRYNATLNRPEVDDQSPIVYHCGSTVRYVHSAPDGLQFCTGSDDKTVKIWSTQVPNKRITTLTGTVIPFQIQLIQF
jgi:WD40 repeat protein